MMNMKSKLPIAICWLTLLCVSTGHAQEDAKESMKLVKELASFEPFLGTWEIDAEWAGGGKLWARNVYFADLDGKLVQAQTFAKDDGGDVYQRYLSIFRWGAEKQTIMTHGFVADGKTTLTELKLKKDKDGKTYFESQWNPQPGQPMIIKQQIKLLY